MFMHGPCIRTPRSGCGLVPGESDQITPLSPLVEDLLHRANKLDALAAKQSEDMSDTRVVIPTSQAT